MKHVLEAVVAHEICELPTPNLGRACSQIAAAMGYSTSKVTVQTPAGSWQDMGVEETFGELGGWE